MSRMVEPSRDEDSLGEDASKQGRRINNIDADEDITLVNDQIDANAEMFDVNALTGDEVFPEQKVRTCEDYEEESSNHCFDEDIALNLSRRLIEVEEFPEMKEEN
ncbi:hypothetical protein Tco_1539969 [Tanacetum coccineum]